MLAVDNQERVGIFAESEQLARAIVMQLRARLGGKNDRAGRRAEAAVDVFSDLARPPLVEQALKTVDRVFVSCVHRAGRRQHVARQNQRIKAMLALGDEQSRVGDDFLFGVRLRAIRGISLGQSLFGHRGVIARRLDRVGVMRNGDSVGFHAPCPLWRNFCRPRRGYATNRPGLARSLWLKRHERKTREIGA